MAAIASTWKLTAAILLGLIVVGVRSATPGIVTNFTVNGNQSAYAQVSLGMPLVVTCRTMFNTSAIVLINKVDPLNHTWHISEDDDQGADFNYGASPAWTLLSTPNLPPNMREIVFTIPSAQNGDTGNYTCSSGSAGVKSTIRVNVISEATSAVLTVNNQQYTSTYNTDNVVIGQQYVVTCTISGGNPHPTVNLTSYKGALPNPVTTYGTNATYNTITGQVNRYTTVTVNSWTIDSTLIGRPLTCTGGVRTPNAVVATLIPTSNQVAPQFTCGDNVVFPVPASQSTLTISCQVFAPNLTSSFVTWINSTRVNNTIPGVVGQTITYNVDSRYTLQIATQPNGFYLMTLTVNNAKQISDLYKNQYKFVASNANGQALHAVTVVAGSGSGYTGGALPNALSTLSLLLTLLIAAAAAGTLML